jgi:hypothetical protein
MAFLRQGFDPQLGSCRGTCFSAGGGKEKRQWAESQLQKPDPRIILPSTSLEKGLREATGFALENLCYFRHGH